jgi:hypothetical protein
MKIDVFAWIGLLAAVIGLSACAAADAGGNIAFEDCYNRPPLYQIEHGCREGD